MRMTPAPAPDTFWYKDAVIYQLHVKSFCDSNADGIGDFAGLTSRLDYLQTLGVTAIWLLPFYPSPQRDDGYDIADYLNINPDFGTMRDFKRFLQQAHLRGLRVITELVINHTSDQHEWFRRSRTAPPNSRWRDYYVWSDTPERYADARIIFKDFESSNWTWDPVAGAYFWHRFYSHQPDLNFENPAVHKAIFGVIDFWMEMGVDGMRLDAVPYLYEEEGTNCENLPRTYEALRALRAHIDSRYPDRMLLAEANQWPEDAVAYFGNGDICNMAFHFPLMPRMFMSVQMEDWYPIVDILEQTPPLPANAQWAIFLRNHDELTLEMVTDEERDYMYRYYAHDRQSRINQGIRRRLAPLLNRNRRKIEIMNVLLFSLPGTPIVYYGDEIGMGDNHYLGDRDGVRTPMQWSGDRNAGFSRANPQKMFLPIIIDPEYHYETVNVETQQHNLSSLLWWMKRVIAMRRRFAAFARGDITFIHHKNPCVLVFVRSLDAESILVIVNLSRFAQVVELDLHSFSGRVPVDVFSKNRFPPIRESPWVATMGQHDYFWLELCPDVEDERHQGGWTPASIDVTRTWTELLSGQARTMFENTLLTPYLRHRTSAGLRTFPVREASMQAVLPLKEKGIDAALCIVKVSYDGKESDTIMLPLCLCAEQDVGELSGGNQALILARLTGSGVILDALFHPGLHRVLFSAMRQQKRFCANGLTLEGQASASFKKALPLPQRVSLVKNGKRNSSLSCDNGTCFKFFRRVDEGANPDVELNRFLSKKGEGKAPVPDFLGSVHVRGANGERFVFGMLTSWADHAGTLLTTARDSAEQFLEELLGQRELARLDTIDEGVALYPPTFEHTLARRLELRCLFADTAHALGRRIGAMHLVLSCDTSNPDFAPEPFSMLYQRSLYQTRRSKTAKLFKLLRSSMLALSPQVQDVLARVRDKETLLLSHCAFLLERKLPCYKGRIHGDLHLGQILAGGSEFIIRDFEGPRGRSLSERSLKRLALRDLASALFSLHGAALYALFDTATVPARDRDRLAPWCGVWANATGSSLIEGYLESVAGSPVLDIPHQDCARLLRLFLLGTAVNELLEPQETQECILLASALTVERCAATVFDFA